MIRRVVYVLNVRAHLTGEERASLREHGLAGIRLYERRELTDQGKGVLGLAFRLSFRAANYSVAVRDLVDGRRIESRDLTEILSIEDHIKQAAGTLSLLLAAAMAFDGDEVLEL